MTHRAPAGRTAAVLIGSGAIGCLLGVVNLSWHEALESAQVLAGIVVYPPGSPVQAFFDQIWTVLHQALAVSLGWGISERTLALVLSGGVGMLAVQGLAMIIVALSGDVWLAIVAPAFIVMTNVTAGGVTYPLYLVGQSSTDGMVGFSYFALSLNLFGVGSHRAAALLIGFGPAIHPAMGIWGWVVAALTALGSRTGRAALLPATRYFLIGGAAAAACLMTHHASAGGLGGVAALWSSFAHRSEAMSQAFAAWDVHRQPFHLLSGSIFAICVSLGMAVLWLSRFAHSLPDASRVLLVIITVSIVTGTVLSVSYWLPSLPLANVVALPVPSRMMDLGVFAYAALVIGLCGRYRDDAAIQGIFMAMVVTLVGLLLVMDRGGVSQIRAAGATVGLTGAALVLLAERHRRGALWTVPVPRLRRIRGTSRLALSGAVATGLVLALPGLSQAVRSELGDWRTDPLLATAAHRPGLLLTTDGVGKIQLRTRRPILLDMSLDRAVYAPGALPAMTRILDRVYDIDLSQSSSRDQASISASLRRLFEARTVQEWQTIGHEFGVTDVITEAGWALHLPILAANAEFVLYGIPP